MKKWSKQRYRRPSKAQRYSDWSWQRYRHARGTIGAGHKDGRIVADSNNGTGGKQISVAQAAYDAPTAEDFAAWLDKNLADVKVKDADGNVVKNPDGTDKTEKVRRVASATANLDEAKFQSMLHWPAIREQASKYRSGDLSYLVRYAVELTDMVERGEVKIDKATRAAVIDRLTAERQEAEAAKADAMRGAAGQNQAVRRERDSKADLLDTMFAQRLLRDLDGNVIETAEQLEAFRAQMSQS